jgi:hypothetical protein
VFKLMMWRKQPFLTNFWDKEEIHPHTHIERKKTESGHGSQHRKTWLGRWLRHRQGLDGGIKSFGNNSRPALPVNNVFFVIYPSLAFHNFACRAEPELRMQNGFAGNPNLRRLEIGDSSAEGRRLKPRAPLVFLRKCSSWQPSTCGRRSDGGWFLKSQKYVHTCNGCSLSQGRRLVPPTSGVE